MNNNIQPPDNNQDKVLFIGTVVRRRILGRHLAFCDIRLEKGHDNESNYENEIIENSTRIVPVTFHRSNNSFFINNNDDDHNNTFNFPVKKSDLPYGARIQAMCSLRQRRIHNNNNQYSKQEQTSNEMIENNSVSSSNQTITAQWQVLEWKLFCSPHNDAVQVARIGSNGISCTDYLRCRREAYNDAVSLSQTSAKNEFAAKRRHRNGKSPEETRNVQVKESAHHDDNHHSTSSKALRNRIFATFIQKHLLDEDDNSANNNVYHRVLDVAGGKGLLSFELASRFAIQCTVIDPLIRRQPKVIKKLERNNKPIPNYITEYFNVSGTNNANDVVTHIVEEHTCLVGLHPDQCTEDILDAAIQCNKSVAIVPCCVYPTLFPHRRQKNGCIVQTYDDFILYLLQKDHRIQKTILPFEGKNICLYMKV